MSDRESYLSLRARQNDNASTQCALDSAKNQAHVIFARHSRNRTIDALVMTLVFINDAAILVRIKHSENID